MKVMYMDESGKNIITNPAGKVFIFGGLIIEHKNIYSALNEFKKIYQDTRNLLKLQAKKDLDKQKLNNLITEDQLSNMMNDMFNDFELHATKMISRRDQTRGRKTQLNPWKYISEARIFEIIHDILSKLSPYIDNIYMFQMNKTQYTEYLTKNHLNISDEQSYDDMIGFIVDEYNNLLISNNTKGVLIPDKLDSLIRDKFVDSINNKNIVTFWAEPVTVESSSNAFTQLIDLITYFYYKIYIKDTRMSNYRAIDRAYKLYLKDKIIIKDFCNTHDVILLN